MEKEQVKAELNKKYAGQIMRPGSVIDIIVDAIELFRQDEQPKQIDQLIPIENHAFFMYEDDPELINKNNGTK